jgi:NAD(P)H dehydrogenase (quinone)
MRGEMQISLILAHPRKGSFNHAVADMAATTLCEAGHTVTVHDLYAEKFDPLLPFGEISRDSALPPLVKEHCREIAAADGIVIVHPNWWGMPPAILKGWIDRVLRPGVAYRFAETDGGEGIPIGLLKAKAVVVFNTSNTPAVREQEVFGDPLERIWRDCILSLCGVPEFYRKMFGVVVTSTEGQRKAWLDEVREMVKGAFPPVSS